MTIAPDRSKKVEENIKNGLTFPVHSFIIIIERKVKNRKERTMIKTTYSINVSYQFVVEHKGAPYTFDGVHFMNAGEFKEAIRKAVAGLECKKDANTPFDVGSDIEETNTSVKSSGATISPVKGDTLEEIMTEYFERVHSDNWDYVTIVDEHVVVYNMNKKEFKEFVEMFGRVNNRKVVRLIKESSKMIRWFEERIA